MLAIERRCRALRSARTAPSSPRRYHAAAPRRGGGEVRVESSLEAWTGAARAARRATTASRALRITGAELYSTQLNSFVAPGLARGPPSPLARGGTLWR